jgi:hypothetical protein
MKDVAQLSRESARSPAASVRSPLVQRCGGSQCPSGGCRHSEEEPALGLARSAAGLGTFGPNRVVVPGHQAPAHLQISDPADASELEADRVAEAVMRMPGGHEGAISVLREQHPVQREAAGECPNGECPQEEDEQGTLQGKIGGGPAGGVRLGGRQSVTHPSPIGGSGAPLPAAVRGFFEPRFGHDFSKVRIHADPQAATAARSFGAFAYTFGRDIVFATHRYAPGTEDGDRLLAHELTHVVQQGHGDPMDAQDSSPPHLLSRAASSRSPGLTFGPLRVTPEALHPSGALSVDESEDEEFGNPMPESRAPWPQTPSERRTQA